MKNFDKVLFLSVLAILAIGLAILYSASKEYYHQNIVLRQAFWILSGIVLLFVAARVDYQRFISISYLLYGINILLLVLVLFFGKARGGAHRWISFGAFNIQPSEFAKITLVLALSAYMSARRADAAKISFPFGALCLVLPAFALILIEPDLGTALLLVPITLAMLFIAGARLKHLAGIVFLGMSALPVFWRLLKDYQRQRLFVFVNPNIDPLGSGYTVIQSKIAVGAGGLFGKGWLGGTQNQLNFLPERHTDFIFSVVGEEWGFLGALILMLLYALIIYRGIKIIETTPDTYGRLMAAGLVTLFSLQVIISVGMTIGFLPVVGLTLPLISYGGSSIVTMLVCMGLLLNIGMRRPLF
ncbi:MAG: rod shape-determining protein RodA [Candidatus Omnitrophota bacterium]